MRHLYVHVPFCASLCHYCAFYSEPNKGDTIHRYLDALEIELAHWTPRLQPETIFFGGGTPTLLNMNQLERLLSNPAIVGAVRETPRHRHNQWEFTFESNPATLSLDKARLLRSFGVNRISIGVQSFDERVLEKLGRIHSPAQALKSYQILREAGFDNVNIDLMFALPGQDMADWEKTLRQAIALQPEHISTYCLTLEEDTVFWRLFQEGAIKPSEDEEAEMYQRTWAILDEAGYEQYEISNFAHRDVAANVSSRTAASLSPQSSVPSPYGCAHNIAYWRATDWIGLGPSAASHCDGRRWKNISNTDEYIARLQRGDSPADFEETLALATRAGEYVAFGLRMMAGVSGSEFRQRFGCELVELWGGEIRTLLTEDLIRWKEGSLQLTARGKLLADEVSSHFVGQISML